VDAVDGDLLVTGDQQVDQVPGRPGGEPVGRQQGAVVPPVANTAPATTEAVAQRPAGRPPPELRGLPLATERKQRGDPGGVQVDPGSGAPDEEAVGPGQFDRGVAGRVEGVVDDLLDDQGGELVGRHSRLEGQGFQATEVVQSGMVSRSEVETSPFLAGESA
jgi:hypothetical protein